MSSTCVAPRVGAPAFEGGVGVVVWPAERDTWEALREAGTPRLLLVEQGCRPPVEPECCQDWMWRTGDERELRVRVQQLALRALAHGAERPRVDSLGVLHVGLRSVALPPKERALVTALLDRFGEVVSRDELVEAAWPGGIRIPNVLASRVSTLRSRLACVGLEIVGSRRAGYTLRTTTSPDEAVDADGGFDDELGRALRLLEARQAARPQDRAALENGIENRRHQTSTVGYFEGSRSARSS